MLIKLSDTHKDFNYTRTKRSPYAEMKDAHYHPYYEFYYLLSGTRKFFINDTIYSVDKGDLIIIPKGEIHRTTYISGDTHERIAIMFSDQFISHLIDTIGEDVIRTSFAIHKLSIPANKRDYILNLFDRIAREHQGIDIYSTELLKRYVEELILFVIRSQASTDVTTNPQKIDDEIISDAARFISTNYNKQITLDTLAAKYGMSTSYFSRKFKSATGFGYKEYLVTIRINEATRLLSSSDLSITEIATRCGFEDGNYFGDCFRKIKGLSPREYRNSLF